MMFGKLENNIFIQAPTKIQIEENIIYNPTNEMLITEGWFPVEENELFTEPPEGYQYIPVYTQLSDKIVQDWELAEMPNEILPEEALNIIMKGGI